jgi:hypothetical protein
MKKPPCRAQTCETATRGSNSSLQHADAAADDNKSWELVVEDCCRRFSSVCSVVVRPADCPARCPCETCRHVRRMTQSGPVSFYCCDGCKLCSGVDRLARVQLDHFVEVTNERLSRCFRQAEDTGDSQDSSSYCSQGAEERLDEVTEEKLREVPVKPTKSQKKRTRLRKQK